MNLRPTLFALLTSASLSLSAAPGPWVADLGNGTYRNPVLHADYSDPDAIRVGDDYWMTASSFSHVPGLPILHSKDLVNWELVNHALPSLLPEDHFRTPRHGAGVWAPALRHHAGKFWLFSPDPDFGLYVLTATDPKGQWSAPHLLKAGKGLIDPCPFWDDDGQAYVIHGWAKSRAGINNKLTLHRMSPDGSQLLDEGKIIIDGDKLPGWRTLEGPKLYKREGWYYVFAPAGGVAEGYQAVFRSRSLWGPYEVRITLDQGTTKINGPHQGAWVDTPSGEDWFLHFQELPAAGRIVHLQPMRWTADGWPEMGTAIDANGKGEPVLTHRKPGLPPQPVATPPSSDDFAGPRLGLQWQWQGNPAAHSYALEQGALRLNCLPLPAAGTFWLSPQPLLQKFPAPSFTATTEVTLTSQKPGDAAGLLVFGFNYAWIGLEQDARQIRLVLKECIDAEKQKGDHVLASIPYTLPKVHLRVTVKADRSCHFAFSTDGKEFIPLESKFLASSSRWVGAKVGVFARSAPDTASEGFAHFSHFTVTP